MSELRLEPWGEGDLPLLERIMGDPAMTEHLGGPETPEKIAERQKRYEKLPSTGTGVMFKIVDADTGEGVGSVGYWERDLGDTTTLADASVVEEIRTRAAESPQED